MMAVGIVADGTLGGEAGHDDVGGRGVDVHGGRMVERRESGAGNEARSRDRDGWSRRLEQSRQVSQIPQ